MHACFALCMPRTLLCVPLGSGGFRPTLPNTELPPDILLWWLSLGLSWYYKLYSVMPRVMPPVLRTRAQAPASPMAPPGSTCTHQTGHQPAYGCSSGLGIAERDVGITFGGAGICPLLLARLAPSFDAYLDLSESAAHELDAHADASWGDRNIYPKWTHPHLRRCGCPTPSEENLTTSLVGRRLHHVHGV